VKKKPQKKWFKQKLRVFFLSFTKNNVSHTSNLGFFFSSAKRLGILERKKKASYFTQMFGFALLFFDSYCTWAKQNKKRGFC
jgi:hypothetical protein